MSLEAPNLSNPARAHYQLMALYNRDMNHRLYELLKPLAFDDLTKDRGAFFKSLFGTLSHILNADILWMKRFCGHPSAKAFEPVMAFASPKDLDDILFPDLKSWAKARFELDALIMQAIATLTEDDFATSLEFSRLNGDRHKKPLGLALSHFFNHQTHHRGQITTLLSQIGLDIGVTDVITWVDDQRP